MYCTYCNFQNKPDNKFCESCGKPIVGKNSSYIAPEVSKYTGDTKGSFRKRLPFLFLLVLLVAIAAIAIVFALDGWYQGFGPDNGRLQGRWECRSTAHTEGVAMVMESCLADNGNGSLTPYYMDWNDNNKFVVNKGYNPIGTGSYQLSTLGNASDHQAPMEIDMRKRVNLSKGVSITSGDYIVEMRNINELELWLENGNPHGYQLRLRRLEPKFDLSVIAAYLIGL